MREYVWSRGEQVSGDCDVGEPRDAPAAVGYGQDHERSLWGEIMVSGEWERPCDE